MLLASGQDDPYLAGLANDGWWHALRKRLGLAVRYEYCVMLPRDYDKDVTTHWPLIVLLHGLGGHADKVYEKHAAEFAEMRSDVIVVAPSTGGGLGWQCPPLADVLDEVLSKHRVDAGRVYLTGFSMGGYGTWAMALAMPHRFAAIAPVCGGPGNPQQAHRIQDMPVWFLNGDKDYVTSVEQAQPMVDALEAIKADIRFTIIKGADHGGSLRHAYRMPELYEWMLSHRRP